MDSAACDKSIKSIATRGAKLDADIHLTAVSVLSHFAQHGDTTLINRLVIAMPKSGRKNALVAWALHHGQLAQNDDKKTREAQPLVKAKDEKAFDLEAASATPFWTFKATEGVPVFSFETYTASLQKSLKAAIDKEPDVTRKAILQTTLSALTGIAAPKAVEPALL